MLAFIIAPDFIIRLLGVSSPEGIAASAPALRMYALSLALGGLNSMLQNFFQTTERERFASLIALMREFAFITLFAFIFARLKINFIWLCFLFAEIATFLSIADHMQSADR